MHTRVANEEGSKGQLKAYVANSPPLIVLATSYAPKFLFTTFTLLHGSGPLQHY